jgi:hypothetical protein
MSIKDKYVALIDGTTGKVRYHLRDSGERVLGLSQIQKKKIKASTYNKALLDVKLTATGKSEKGISKEYYNHFDSHLICRNPATSLKHYRIAS